MRRQHPAAIYNEKRRILFSNFHKDLSETYSWLESYRSSGTLSHHACLGLKAELTFYEQHQKEFQLVVAGDVGDHTDFAGQVDGRIIRFDVTTNLDVKKLDDYEPFQRGGAAYKIAVMDRETFDLKDVVDINFPFCNECGDGRIFDVAFLLGVNAHEGVGIPGDHDQIHGQLCPVCCELREVSRVNTHFLPDFETYVEELDQAVQDNYQIDVQGELNTYACDALRYLKKFFKAPLVAIGSESYRITDPKNGDGYWCTSFRQVTPLVNEHLAMDIDYALEHR